MMEASIMQKSNDLKEQTIAIFRIGARNRIRYDGDDF